MIYAADTICMLSKSKERNTDKEVVGNIITVRLYKSRLTKENSSVEVLLTYDKGLDRYWGLLDICEKYGIFKKLAKQWEMPDGTKVFETKIKKNPEKFFTKDILDKIEAGIRLTGGEVKSIKAGNINLKGSFIDIHAGVPMLRNAHVSKYKFDSDSALS